MREAKRQFVEAGFASDLAAVIFLDKVVDAVALWAEVGLKFA
jgi:hypothetical protein